MYILFLLGTVLATTQGSSIDMVDLEKSHSFQPKPVPVEIQFITQKDQVIGGDTQVTYHASLCGGCYFDGLLAHVAVNLVNNPWDYDLGDYITVYAKDSAGTILASNLNPGTKVPAPDFNFTYHAKYGDLIFNVTTGPAPSFVFTLSLSFDFNVSVDRAAMPCEPRWQMTPMEYATFLKFREGDDSGHLDPIFITHTKKVVTTRVLQYLQLDYCFGANHQYNISITVVADDQKSGFATYACKKTYNKGICDIRTPYRDISGGPANFVEVTLYGPQDYGPVDVIVRGDGRYGLPNTYILTASSPY